MNTVLIYKTELLPLSETFIKAQVGALTRFRARYIGLRRCRPSIDIPDNTITVVQDASFLSRLRLRAYTQFGLAPRFYAEARRANPKLLHAHFAPGGATALPLASHLNLPLVVTLHGFDVTVRDSFLNGSIEERLYLQRRKSLGRRASLFVCVSQFIRRKALELGFPEDKLRVHYTGIDRQLFSPGTEAQKKNLIVFVGRLVEKKGCDYLLNAMKIVREQCPAAELVIIGDGPLRSKLEAIAKDANLRCDFLGNRPSEVVRDWLRVARLFCAPSIEADNGDSEGLGMVFAEAQSMGTPVVSFAHGGIPEVVRHGETGLLAPERDVKQLAQHLLRLLQDDLFRRQCSERAIQWIEERFDLVTQTRELEGLYDEVLASGI